MPSLENNWLIIFGVYNIISVIVAFSFAFWVPYLLRAAYKYRQYRKGALRNITEESKYYDFQVAYHYQTEQFKCYFLLAIEICEMSTYFSFAGAHLSDILLLENSYYSNIKECRELVLSSIRIHGYQYEDFMVIQIYPSLLAQSFLICGFALIYCLTKYISYREFKIRKELTHMKYCIILTSIVIAIFIGLGSNRFTIILKRLLSVFLFTIYFILFMKGLSNFRLFLKKKSRHFLLAYGSITAYNRGLKDERVFFRLSCVLGFGYLLSTFGQILMRIMELTTLFLYSGKCMFKVIYNVSYTPPVSSNSSITKLYQFDFATQVFGQILTQIGLIVILVPYLGATCYYFVREMRKFMTGKSYSSKIKYRYNDPMRRRLLSNKSII